MGGPGDNEGTGGVSEKARSSSVPQASQLGYSTKSRGQQVRIGKSAEANLAELVASLLEEAMRTPSSALPLMANPFVRTAGQLTFAWSLVGIELKVLTSHDKLKLGNKSLEVYQMLVQHIDRDNSGLSLARRKGATCFLRWIKSVMTNGTVQVGHQKAMGSKTMERRVRKMTRGNP